MKFCKDCVHAIPDKYSPNGEVSVSASCDKSPMDNNVMANFLVTGKGKKLQGCNWMRLPHGPCGTDGKLFEPKEAV